MASTLLPVVTQNYVKFIIILLSVLWQPLPQKVLNRVRSSACSFNFQYTLFSLRSASSCLHLLPCLPLTSIFPSIMYFRTQFLRKMWLIQLVFLFLLFVGYFSPPWRFKILLHFSQDQSNLAFPFFSSTFQNFPDISDLLSAVSKFQHHTKLCSKCSTLLVCSLNISPICWWKEPSVSC